MSEGTPVDRSYESGIVLGRRQYVFAPVGTPAPEGFRSRAWAGGELQWSPCLPVTFVNGPEGKSRALLGVATETRGDDVLRQLREQTSDELLQSSRSWEGRWILLDGSQLHPNAFATLPALRKGVFVSSTPALLPDVGPPLRVLSRYAKLSYIPGPATGLPGVSRVMSSQYLDLEQGQTVFRPLPHPQVVSEEAAPALVDRLGEILLATIRAAASSGPVKLPLTAGYDSRLLLAACVAADVRPVCVTQWYPDIDRADILLPQEMCRRLGLEHHVARPSRRRSRLGELYDRQVGGLVAETDRRFLERGQFDWLQPGDSLLRAVAFDGTRDFTTITTELSMAVFEKAFSPSAAQLEAFAEWLELVDEHPQPLNAHDRYWIEQKLGTYMPTSEVALDLLGAHSWLPGSSWEYQETGFSLPLSWRVKSLHHEMLIDRWAPSLSGLPYNPPTARWRRWRRIPGAVLRRAQRARAVATRGGWGS